VVDEIRQERRWMSVEIARRSASPLPNRRCVESSALPSTIASVEYLNPVAHGPLLSDVALGFLVVGFRWHTCCWRRSPLPARNARALVTDAK